MTVDRHTEPEVFELNGHTYLRCFCGSGLGHPFDPGELCPGVPTPRELPAQEQRT